MYNQPSWYVTPSSTQASQTGGPGSLVNVDARTWYGNFIWTWEPADSQRWMFGTDVRHEGMQNLEFNVDDWTVRDRGPQTGLTAGDSYTQSAFTQLEWDPADRLQVSLGGRLDFWRNFNGERDFFNPDIPATQFDPRSRRALTGKVALVYGLTEDLSIRAGVGSAFRFPTNFELFRTTVFSGRFTLANPELEPERTTTWEAGLRQNLGDRVLAEATIYENRIENLVYTATDFQLDPTGDTRRRLNAGKGFTRGVEVRLQTRLTNWLELRSTYTYSRAVISENQLVPESEGYRVPYVPQHMTTHSLLAYRGKWTASVSGRYLGDVYTTDTNADMTDGVFRAYDPYFVADAAVSYQIHPMVTLYGSLENGLDRRYFQFYLGQGRTFYGGLRIRID